MLASYISKAKHRLWYSSRLKDQKLQHCLTGYEVLAPSSAPTTKFLAAESGRPSPLHIGVHPWQLPLIKKIETAAAIFLQAVKCIFRQLISIKRDVVKDLLLQEIQF